MTSAHKLPLGDSENDFVTVPEAKIHESKLDIW